MEFNDLQELIGKSVSIISGDLTDGVINKSDKITGIKYDRTNPVSMLPSLTLITEHGSMCIHGFSNKEIIEKVQNMNDTDMAIVLNNYIIFLN